MAAPRRARPGAPALTRLRRNRIWKLGAAASIVATILQPRSVDAADLFASGDQARELCSRSQEWCVGFVTGALDGWAALEAYYSGEKFCLSGEMTTGQIVGILVQALEQRPEPREEPAAYILYERLIERFPCT